MSVRSAQSITVLFTTRNFATGGATDATGTPTGTIYVNGTADAASVTVTNITTGVYKAAVTLPTLAAGDEVLLLINATVAGVADNAVIWGDTKDLALDSSFRPGIDWSNVGAPTTALALTGTTIATTQKVDVETIKTRAVTAAGAIVVGGFVGQDTAALAVNASGRIDVGLWLGTAPLALSSQQVQAIVPDTQKVDLNTIKTQTVTCAGGVTIPAATLASTTNITAGTITTATNVTTVNGLAANVITAASIATDAGSEIAAAVWDLATSGHTTSGTFGAAMNAAGSVGDPWSTSVPGAYGAGTAGYVLGTNLDALITSRMATYAQPSGFLAATFPGGTLASTTNITAGTITTVTTVTNQLTGAQIATAVWQDTTAGDFTVATSPGKVIFTQLGGSFTTTSSSVFSTAALANAGGSTPPTAAEIADKVLGRNVKGGSDGGRTVYKALAGAVNKVVDNLDGTFTVYDTDDTTALFSGTLTRSTSVGSLTGVDPT